MKKTIQKIKIGKLLTQELSIPIITLGSGKTKVLLINGMHGNELSGLVVVNKLLKSLKNLNGQLSIITAANPLAQIFNTRENPIDYKDLNRSFPGDAYGTLTEQLAHAIYQKAITYDYIIDMHTFDAQCPIIGLDMNSGNKKTQTKARELLKAFGPDCVWQINTQTKKDVQYGGALCITTTLQNIPSVAFELPEYYRLTEKIIDRAVNGLKSILQETKLLSGTPQKAELPVYERLRSHATQSGLFVPKKEVLENVKKGEIVGEILNLNTLARQKIRAHANGPILTIMDRELMKPGDITFSIGKKTKQI